MTIKLLKGFALAICLAFVASALAPATPKAAYTFKVHNGTKETIKGLLASPDGKKYGPFDIGKAGLAPGKTITLEWSESTENGNCEWMIKAVYADGSESEAAEFDFCEKDLVLEFT
jgi:hypothetical protein